MSGISQGTITHINVEIKECNTIITLGPIIRDGEFLQTKRFIDPSGAGNSLPRSYVIDARNMEMKYAGGISMNTSICAMLAEMDVSAEGVECP